MLAEAEARHQKDSIIKLHNLAVAADCNPLLHGDNNLPISLPMIILCLYVRIVHCVGVQADRHITVL